MISSQSPFCSGKLSLGLGQSRGAAFPAHGIALDANTGRELFPATPLASPSSPGDVFIVIVVIYDPVPAPALLRGSAGGGQRSLLLFPGCSPSSLAAQELWERAAPRVFFGCRRAQISLFAKLLAVPRACGAGMTDPELGFGSRARIWIQALPSPPPWPCQAAPELGFTGG